MFRVQEADEFALTCPAERMVIASPRPTKLATAERLSELWKHAEDAIRDADAVVFIGYRFPPSDASSRQRLFQGSWRTGSPFLRCTRCLGRTRATRRRCGSVRCSRMLRNNPNGRRQRSVDGTTRTFKGGITRSTFTRSGARTSWTCSSQRMCFKRGVSRERQARAVGVNVVIGAVVVVAPEVHDERDRQGGVCSCCGTKAAYDNVEEAWFCPGPCAVWLTPKCDDHEGCWLCRGRAARTPLAHKRAR
jgi:hypothetical protein